MGFLAPFAPLIGGAVGGLLGGRKSNLEKQIANKINPTLENLMHWAGMANARRQQLEGTQGEYDAIGKGLLGRSSSYFDEANSYEPIARNDVSRASQFYNRLLSPSDSEALGEILGPQRQGIMRGYNNLIQTAGRNSVRGGGRTSAMADFDFRKNSDLLNLVPQARMQAAQGLLQTSGLAGQQSSRRTQEGIGVGQLGLGASNVGLGYGNLALGYGGLANDSSRAVLGQGGLLSDLGRNRLQSGSEWGDIGGRIGTLLGPILGGLGQKTSGLPELKF